MKTAGREARKLGHAYVGTEHLLLAFLSGRQSVAGNILHFMGWEYPVWQSLVASHCGRGRRGAGLLQGLSPCARRVLTLAGQEARRLEDRLVEPEHILLALAREENCTALRLLSQCGGDANTLFSHVYDSLQFRKDLETGKGEGNLKLLEQF